LGMICRGLYNFLCFSLFSMGPILVVQFSNLDFLEHI
jgi:hypothetical protein